MLMLLAVEVLLLREFETLGRRLFWRLNCGNPLADPGVRIHGVGFRVGVGVSFERSGTVVD